MKFLLCLLFVVGFSIGSEAAVKAKGAVHAAVPAGLPPPLLFEQETDLTGIVPEYTQALLDILGRGGNMSLLPRNRLANYMMNGKVDFLCYTNKEWAENANRYFWSNVLFKKREVIVGPAPMPKQIKDLKGKILGTMLGYNYPKLDELFKEKFIIREDGPNEESNLAKLRNDHISYAIIDEIYLNYYKKREPATEKGRDRMLLQEYPVSCSLSKKGTVTVKELNDAIDKLKSSKKLDQIFEKYGSSPL